MEYGDQPLVWLQNSTFSDTEAWNDAYVTLESYFFALGLRNRLLISTLVHRILLRVASKNDTATGFSPSKVSMEEAMKLVAEWFSGVMKVSLPENRMAARGRLAMLLADLPGKWQKEFLAPEPLPEEMGTAMRNSYLQAGPDFQNRTMPPSPIRLNLLMTNAFQTWEALDRSPIIKRILISLVLAILLGLALLLWN